MWRSTDALRDAGAADAGSSSDSTTRSCSTPSRPRSCCTSRRRPARSSSRPSAPASRAPTRSCRCGRTPARGGWSSARLSDEAVADAGRGRARRPARAGRAALGRRPQPGQRALPARARARRHRRRARSRCDARPVAAHGPAAGHAHARRAGRPADVGPRRRERAPPSRLLAVGEPLRVDEVAGARRPRGARRGRARSGSSSVEGDQVRPRAPALRRGRPRGAARAARPCRCASRVAGALQRRAPLAPADALRVARLLLDAGAPIPSDLLVDAARAANLAGDPALGAQLAERPRSPTAPGCRPRSRWRAPTPCASATPTRRRCSPPPRRWPARTTRARLPRAARARALLGPGPRRPRRARCSSEARGWSADAGVAAAGRAAARRLRRHHRRGATVALDTLTALLADPGARRRRRAAWRSGGWRCRCSSPAARARRPRCAPRVRPRIPLRGDSDALALGLVAAASGSRRARTGRRWRRRMAQTLRDAVRANDHEAAGHAAFTLGYLRFLAGRFRDAARWFAEAELHFEQQDTFGTPDPRPRASASASTSSRATSAAAAASLRPDARGARRPRAALEPDPLRRARRGLGGSRTQRRGGRRAAARPTPPRWRPSCRATPRSSPTRRSGPAPRRRGRGRARRARRPLRRAARRGAYVAHAAALAGRDGEALLAVAEELAAIGALRYGDGGRRPCRRGVRPRRPRRTPRAARRRARGSCTCPARAPSSRRSTGSTPPPIGLTAARGAGRRARRPRAQQRRDRRPARAVGPHRRDARLPRDAEARRRRPARALSAAT